MPCYEVNLISIKFKVSNRELLEQALNAVGLTYWKSHSRGNIIEDVRFRINLDKGVVEMDRNPETLNLVNQLKREYSVAAIAQVARKKKWAMKRNAEKIQLKRF